MTTLEHANANAKAWLASIEEMLEACEEERANPAAGEEADTAIRESVLSVMVRDGWREPGAMAEDGAEEFEILLSTGGPALRIWGQLGRYGEPVTAELQAQDWGTPWTRYPAPEATLLRFVSHFWLGE